MKWIISSGGSLRRPWYAWRVGTTGHREILSDRRGRYRMWSSREAAQAAVAREGHETEAYRGQDVEAFRRAVHRFFRE